MRSLVHLLPRVLLNSGDSSDARDFAVRAAWFAVVGPQISRVTSPARLNRKKLVVFVIDDAWRKQLAAMSKQIAFRINPAAGVPLIEDLALVIDPDAVDRAHPSPPEVGFSAPQKHALALAGRAGAIRNPLLRETFLNAAGKCLDRRTTETQRQP